MLYGDPDVGHRSVRIELDGNVVVSILAIQITSVELYAPFDLVIHDLATVTEEYIPVDVIRSEIRIRYVRNGIATLV